MVITFTGQSVNLAFDLPLGCPYNVHTCILYLLDCMSGYIAVVVTHRDQKDNKDLPEPRDRTDHEDQLDLGDPLANQEDLALLYVDHNSVVITVLTSVQSVLVYEFFLMTVSVSMTTGQVWS